MTEIPAQIGALCQDIQQIGQEMRHLAERYEQIYPNFAAHLAASLQEAPSLSEAALWAGQAADAAAAAVRRDYPNQPKLACASGCTACCHLYVKMPAAFADLLAEHIEAHFTGAARRRLIEKLRQAAEKEAAAASDEGSYRNSCPMLGEGGACLAYDRRPLTCRAFTSTTRARCEAMVFGDGSVTSVDQDMGTMRFYIAATEALQAEATRRGDGAAQVPFSTGILAALERLHTTPD